jgi:hypothetical protein
MDVLALVKMVTDFLTANGPLILAVLGAFSAVARVTPTNVDNVALDYVLKVVHLLGLTKPPAPPAA